MAAFRKYERILNKKRKSEAFINLFSDEADETSCNKISKVDLEQDVLQPNGLEAKGTTPTNIITDEELQHVMKEAKKIEGYLKKIIQERMKCPKLFLSEKGETSLLKIEEAKRQPLVFDDIKKFLSFAATQPRPKHQPQWCNLLRRNCMSQIVLVIVEGLGVSEIEILGEAEKKSLPQKTNGDITSNSNLAKEWEPPEWLQNALPHSVSLFGLHLDVCPPSKNPLENLEEIFCIKLGGRYAVTPIVEKIPDSDTTEDNIIKSDEAEDNQHNKSKIKPLPEPNIKSFSLLESLPENKILAAGGQEDKFSRLKLMLCHEELVAYGFPLNIEGCTGYNDPEFIPTHEVFDRVHDKSPMFGVDCEMCLTQTGNELTRVSVVDENYKIIYSKLVTPKRKILNYLTQYSGITEELLANVTTTLKDVQIGFRNVLPKDAILVGHSLDADLTALKLFHPYCIDTSKIYNLTGQRRISSKLKHLSKFFLDKTIQSTEKVGHDPDEDATASLELALLKLRNDPSFGDVVKNGIIPFTFQEQQRMLDELNYPRRAYKPRASYQEIKAIRKARRPPNLFKNPIIKPLPYACDTTVIAMSRCLQKERDILSVLRVTTIVEASDIKDVFKKASFHTDLVEKALVLHVNVAYNIKKMKKSKVETKKLEVARKDLQVLDEELKSLHESLPRNSLLMTFFTGSPCTVPLDNRTNAVLLMDIIGQDKKNYFRRKNIN